MVLFLFAVVAVSAATTCETITSKDALLIIDVQNSFLPTRPIPTYKQPNYVIDPDQIQDGNIIGGSLAVNDADQIIDVLNSWITAFQSSGGKIFASLDWHPDNSCSFCSTGAKCGPFGIQQCGDNGTASASCPASLATRCLDDVSVDDYNQGTYVQWPHHCVEQSFGARFDPFLNIPADAIVVKKGFNVTVDSYSAYGGALSIEDYPFDLNDTSSDLDTQPMLKQLVEQYQIERLWVTGVATDYCVMNSILDSLGKNVEGESTKPSTIQKVILIQSAARGVDPSTTAAALQTVTTAGAFVLGSGYIQPNDSISAFCQMDSSSGSSSSTDVLPILVAVFASLTVILSIWNIWLHRKLKSETAAVSLQYSELNH